MRGLKREMILRVLLAESKSLSKNELSKRANCSRQWVILFLRELEKKKLVKKTKVVDPAGLIKFWLTIHKKPKKYQEYMIKEPLKLLKKTKSDYALTTYQAENIVQRHLFPSRIDIYIKEEDLQAWHSFLLKEGLYGKGNVRTIVTEEQTFYGKRKLNGLSVVSLPQLIIDLFTEGGPAAEAAEILLAQLRKHVS
jgi:DNA-binding Lrp family transcriptional regulator